MSGGEGEREGVTSYLCGGGVAHDSGEYAEGVDSDGVRPSFPNLHGGTWQQDASLAGRDSLQMSRKGRRP